jgi:hypothetical protein
MTLIVAPRCFPAVRAGPERRLKNEKCEMKNAPKFELGAVDQPRVPN